MNKVQLVGRLAKDPELRTTGTGKSVCSFPIAVDRRYKQEGQPTADFFTVTAWGRQAEVIEQYLAKGRQIAIAGRLQSRSYDAKDGTKRYVTEVVLEEFDFISSGNSGNAAQTQRDAGQAVQAQQAQYTASPQQAQGFDTGAGYSQQRMTDMPLDDGRDDWSWR
ncbi:MAG: single-stranded DNA-binding protein [Christensenella sp.]|uniref:single-stranded DNA-binding protein n=1 Tax=Christensenella sp. TaxID=1935934 RepID=UPI002B1FEBA5|nr:single-stranded DNA-binding protein [Christensenella sp.]MEA5004708.1 single-stranded DNA-binding protein [Christensenella sp.]